MKKEQLSEKDLFKYLNSIPFQENFNNLIEENISPEFPGHGLPDFDQNYLWSTFHAKQKSTTSRIFCLYHFDNDSIVVEAVGISDKHKITKYSSTYYSFIMANIMRCLNIAEENDTVLLFLDNKLSDEISKFLEICAHPRANQVINIPIMLKGIWAERPMWCRFRLMHYFIKFICTLYDQEIILYCMDSDYIPSAKILDCNPAHENLDIVFTSNRDSFLLWPINEGMYCLKNSPQMSIFADFILFIYYTLSNDNYVKKFWSDPRIWRGAQASLVLSSFNFMQNINTRNINDVKYLKSVTLNNFTINTGIYNSQAYNSPPNCESFKQKCWELDKSSCYHFTGHHKGNTHLSEFLNFCVQERVD